MLAVALAALVGSASPLPSVDELVARHRRALGRIASTTAHWAGTVAHGDVVEHFEVTADYTGRFRQSWTTPIGTSLEGSDGKNDWSEDENGNVTIQPTRHAFSFEYSLVRLNDIRIEDMSQASVAGSADVAGRKAYALKISDEVGTMTLYLDAETGLVDGADVRDHVIRYKTYRTFDGMPVPIVIEDTAGGTTVTRTIDSLTFGAPVTGQFEPPASREPTFPSGKPEVATNFDSPHGLIVLLATINDKPLRLLLDSGSSSSVIDIDVAKRLGLPTAGTAQVQGAAMLSGTFARADKLEVAGISFSPFVVEAVPLKLPAAIAHDGIDGVLGYDFLSHVVTRIAYFSRELRFADPAHFTYGGTGAVLTADFSMRVPHVPASMGDGDKGTFTIDTGSDEGLVLYYDFANAHPHDFVDPLEMSQSSSSGVGGEFTTRSGIVTEFNLGSYSISRVPTEIVLHASGAFAPGQSQGLIGAKLLSAFRAVFLDYRGKRIILEK
jgi:aspartyl protease